MKLKLDDPAAQKPLTITDNIILVLLMLLSTAVGFFIGLAIVGRDISKGVIPG